MQLKAEIVTDNHAQIQKWFTAVLRGDIQTVSSLIEEGIDINTINALSYNALILAIKSYQYEIAALLCEKNIDLAYQDSSGNNALWYAAGLNEDPRFVNLLLHHGMLFSPQDEIAYRGDCSNLEAILEGLSPQQTARMINHAAAAGQLLFLQKFIALNGLYFLQDHLDFLAKAAYRGQLHIVKWALTLTIFIPDEHYLSALYCAAITGQLPVIRVLFAEIIKIARCIRNDTAQPDRFFTLYSGLYKILSTAVICNQLPVLKFFLNQFNYVAYAQKNNINAFAIILFKNHQNYLKKIKNWRITNIASVANESLTIAAKAGHIQLITCLLDKFNADPFYKNASKDTILHIALLNEHQELITYLLDRHPKLFLEQNADNKIAFDYILDDSDLLKKILDCPYFKNLRRKQRGMFYDILECNLWDFVLLANQNNIKLLLDYGVDINSLEKYNHTFIELAISYGHFSLIPFLLQQGSSTKNALEMLCYKLSQMDYADVQTQTKEIVYAISYLLCHQSVNYYADNFISVLEKMINYFSTFQRTISILFQINQYYYFYKKALPNELLVKIANDLDYQSEFGNLPSLYYEILKVITSDEFANKNLFAQFIEHGKTKIIATVESVAEKPSSLFNKRPFFNRGKNEAGPIQLKEDLSLRPLQTGIYSLLAVTMAKQQWRRLSPPPSTKKEKRATRSNFINVWKQKFVSTKDKSLSKFVRDTQKVIRDLGVTEINPDNYSDLAHAFNQTMIVKGMPKKRHSRGKFFQFFVGSYKDTMDSKISEQGATM